MSIGRTPIQQLADPGNGVIATLMHLIPELDKEVQGPS
jgi:hypothetical protein